MNQPTPIKDRISRRVMQIEADYEHMSIAKMQFKSEIEKEHQDILIPLMMIRKMLWAR